MVATQRTRVCVPVCEKDLATMRAAFERAAEFSDVIELRLDCLQQLRENIATVLNGFSRPLILTFRPKEQGGYRHSTRAERIDFWTSLAPQIKSDWWDVEGDLAQELSLDSSRIIVSHHDFSGVPTDLEQIYERLAGTSAAVVKIAVQANDIVDCIPIFRLLERARSEGRELIAVAMGNAGIATRILGPSRGAFLTYGALDDETGTAPGQVTARKLRSLYHIDRIDEETMICGLVGLPVKHSVSPQFHNAAFESEGINGVYLPFEVRDVKQFFKRMVHPRSRELSWKLRGLSITAPHKQMVLEFLDWIDPMAEEIGAVNTVVVEEDRLLGYNTDAAGFIASLLERFGSLRDARVAVIGAGGAARAAVYALQVEGAVVTVFARDTAKVVFDVSCESLAGASFAGFDVVVNATPLGSGAFIAQSPATREQLKGVRCVYDLIYNPRKTRLMREAVASGCDTLGGLEMLIAQAKLQFELWTGHTPKILPNEL